MTHFRILTKLSVRWQGKTVDKPLRATLKRDLQMSYPLKVVIWLKPSQCPSIRDVGVSMGANILHLSFPLQILSKSKPNEMQQNCHPPYWEKPHWKTELNVAAEESLFSDPRFRPSFWQDWSYRPEGRQASRRMNVRPGPSLPWASGVCGWPEEKPGV